VGEQARLDLEVLVSEIVTFTATLIGADQFDPDPSNNTASASSDSGR
jgi:hypothetical protein